MFGLRYGEIEPGKPAGSARGIKMTDFEPGKAVRRGLTEANGIENSDSEPESDAGRACGIRKREIEPGKPAGSARGIKMTDFEPERPSGRATSGSDQEGPPGREQAGSQRKIVQLSENNYLCRNRITTNGRSAVGRFRKPAQRSQKQVNACGTRVRLWKKHGVGLAARTKSLSKCCAR